MKPSEFLECTYIQLYKFATANNEREISDYKQQIILFEKFGRKIISGLSPKPKNIDLITDTFKNLFEKELIPHQQTPEEQIAILRSMK